MLFNRFYRLTLATGLLSTIMVANSLAEQPRKAAAPLLSELTLAQTQTLLRTQQVSMAQLSDYYLQRIQKFDENGAQLNSVATLSNQLDQQVNVLEQKLKSGQPLGSLFGAIVLLKDNIDATGMPNTAGSWLMRNHVPTEDAYLVKQLKAHDAIILGKTNLSEWANFRSNMSSSGWSSLHGQTLNPHDPTRTPCGSSSGSGSGSGLKARCGGALRRLISSRSSSICL